MKILSVFLILLLLAACGPSAQEIAATADAAQAQTETAAPTLTPTSTPTITPTSTPISTPTPTFTDVYESKNLGISIRYPTGWNANEYDTRIVIEKDNKYIVMDFYPAEYQGSGNTPIDGLISYIQFAGYILPDKERIHLVNLNDSEFAFGSYNNPGESPGFLYPKNPMFMAMRFTKDHTIVIEFHAPPGEEEKNREILDLVISSLPPSPSQNIIPTPTLAPNVTVELPTPPKGFHWQGVQNIDLALLVPDDWFVVFFPRTETWQSGLQEYDYQFTITQENPDYTGTYSPVLGLMRVTAIKDNSINVNNVARDLHQELKNHPNTTKVIEEQVSQQGKNVIHKLHLEGTNADSDAAPGDPGYNLTLFRITIANREAKTLYILFFKSATEIWEQEWETGEIMMETLLEFLQR